MPSDPPNTRVDATDVRTIEIVDPVTGERTIISGTHSQVVVGRHGELGFIEQEVRARGNDLRVIRPETEVFACGCGCGTPLLTRPSVLFCGICQIPVALTHAKTWEDGLTKINVCPSCWTPGHVRRAIGRFLRWLLLA